MIRTLDEALDYLYSFINYEVDASFAYGAVHYNVDRTVKLLELLGNPQEKLHFIHVAGTKGKGSVCTILDTLLRFSHQRTGLFTSPHIARVNERISVCGTPVPDGEFIDLINRFPPLIDTFKRDNLPTTFEILTAMAVLYFSQKKVDYAVLETGMGGRFDSTNFCDPLLSVITPISYDHVDKLGDRIEDIAGEKAGIIKPGRPVVLGYQVYDVADIFLSRAAESKAPLYRVDSHCSFQIRESSEKGVFFDAVVDGMRFTNLFLSLAGRHQVENAVTALLCLKIVDLLPAHSALVDALSSVAVPTRLELIEGEKRFLLDSAHNEDSARVLADALRSSYRYDRLLTIVGIVKDKDIRGILRQLSEVSDQLIITDPVTHKELDTDAVVSTARSLHTDTVFIRDLAEAIGYAIDNSHINDIILITGSFYTTSPARSILIKHRINRCANE
jgi:dihydrofolate synthase/folylpolyglutamate synthase